MKSEKGFIDKILLKTVLERRHKKPIQSRSFVHLLREWFFKIFTLFRK